MKEPNKEEKCYQCGRRKGSRVIRVQESPKDEFGIRVKVCFECYYYMAEATA